MNLNNSINNEDINTAKIQNKKSPIETQQSINKPGNNVVTNDNTAQKENVNKQITPYDDTNINTNTGAQPATGQSTGTATGGQVATDSGGQAAADSVGAAHYVTASQSAISLSVILHTSVPTG